MSHLPIAKPDEIGLDPQRLQTAYALMDQWTQGENPPIPGVARHCIGLARIGHLSLVPEGIRRARPWGLGWQMNHPGTSSSLCDVLGRHIYGHTGSTGTLVWIDPATLTFCVIFTSGGMTVDPWRLSLSNVVASAIV